MISASAPHTHVKLRSPLHCLDARVKLVCASALVCAILIVPIAHNARLAPYAGLLVALVMLSRLPIPWLVARTVILLPFLVIGALALLIGDTYLHPEAVALYVSIAGKCVLALLATSVLLGTTPVVDLLRAGQALGLPRTVTALLGFAMTYLATLTDEARAMVTARNCRGRVRGTFRAVAVAASMLRTLMVRTFERAQRIALAMVARGYNGRMPDLRRAPAPAGHVLVGIAFIALIIAPHLTGLL